MNKIIRLICLWLFPFMGGQALAQSSTTSETLRVWMDDATIVADGASVTYIKVYENDVQDYTSFNMSMIVPEGVHIGQVKAGRGMRNAIDLSVRAAETHAINCNMPSETQINIICTSSQNDNFYPDDEDGNPMDELFSIGLVADHSMINGTYTVTTEGVKFVLNDGATFPGYIPAELPTFQLTITGGQDRVAVTLNETTDNSAELISLDGNEADVTLIRTLITGSYNTFAVPFDIDAATLTTQFGADVKVKQLIDASLNSTTGELSLAFANAESIVAGNAYLIKVSENVVNPVFEAVTIHNSMNPTCTSSMNFIPLFGATTIEGDNPRTILFLGSGDMLYNPMALPTDMKGFRGYFLLKENVASVRAFRMDFGDKDTTPVENVKIYDTDEEVVYDLNGRRTNPHPQGKGVYIVNGKKESIK